MKKQFQLFTKVIFFTFLALSVAACGDDDDPTSSGSFQIGDISYPLSSGYIYLVNVEEAPESYQFALELYGGNIKLDEVNPANSSGKGHYIAGNVLSSMASDLAPGDYIVNPEKPLADTPFDAFDWGYKTRLDLDDPDEDNEDGSGMLKSLTMKVSKDGSIYTITFNGMDENDIEVSGSYTGTLKMLKKE